MHRVRRNVSNSWQALHTKESATNLLFFFCVVVFLTFYRYMCTSIVLFERFHMQQLQELKTILGQKFFITHPNQEVRSADGIILLKQMEVRHQN